MADVAAAMAGVLEKHQASLVASDPEFEAYATLASDFHGIATTLARTAARMAGYRDLPMGSHDESVLMSDEATEKFEIFVRAERHLLDLLRTSVE